MTGSASSADGSVRVVTDAGGVPERLWLDRAALAGGEQALAAEVLALCRTAGARARAELAERLAAAGIGARTAAELGLPAPGAAPREESDEPDSWVRR